MSAIRKDTPVRATTDYTCYCCGCHISIMKYYYPRYSHANRKKRLAQCLDCGSTFVYKTETAREIIKIYKREDHVTTTFQEYSK